MKPGDIGEDTISLHVHNNDAYACMAIDITATPENGINEPEAAAGDVTEEGELQNYLQFAFWADDGDNVYETDEVIFWSGSAADLFDGKWKTLADAEENVWDESGALPGGETRYIAKAWCFGELVPNPVAAGQGENPTVATGFTCNGAGSYNDAQTDGIMADVMFYAVQSRHNAGFTCDSMNPQPPVVDGVIGAGEWAGCTSIGIASQMGSVCVLAYPNYMYVKYEINDTTDARTLYDGEVGNDQISINVNPTDGAGTWGFPYDLIFETSALDAANGGHHILPWNPKVNSGTTADNWASRLLENNLQTSLLPASVQSATAYTGSQRITEWRLPMTAVAQASSIKVGGAVDVGDGNSYVFPVGLDWNSSATFTTVPLQ